MDLTPSKPRAPWLSLFDCCFPPPAAAVAAAAEPAQDPSEDERDELEKKKSGGVVMALVKAIDERSTAASSTAACSSSTDSSVPDIVEATTEEEMAAAGNIDAESLEPLRCDNESDFRGVNEDEESSEDEKDDDEEEAMPDLSRWDSAAHVATQWNESDWRGIETGFYRFLTAMLLRQVFGSRPSLMMLPEGLDAEETVIESEDGSSDDEISMGSGGKSKRRESKLFTMGEGDDVPRLRREDGSHGELASMTE